MATKTVESLNHIYDVKKQWLTCQQYLQLLQNFDHSKCTNVPAVRPQPGDLYIYHHETKLSDWKCDEYQWQSWGQKAIPAKNPTLVCRYYNARGTKEFQRRAYVLYGTHRTPSSTTLVHYVGSLEHVVQLPHGNRKLCAKPHIRTAVSQLDEQKRYLAEQPKKVYRKLCTATVAPECTAVMLPRDSKQVKNTIYQERLRRMVSQDDVYALYVLAHHVTLYPKRLEIAPDFVCTLYSDTMKKEFDRIKHIRNLTLYYDSTYNLGDFYVSPLVMRHEVFVQCPSIPVAYQVHDSKRTRIHEEFFRFLTKQGWDLESQIIVTDREAAIRKGIKEAIPNAHTFVCWNHIQQDVKNWVLKHINSSPDDVQVYVNHVWDLLDSDSHEELDSKLDQMSRQWSSKFLAYFNTYLKVDITENAKWILQKEGVYTPGSGVTINPSESVNALLKRLLDNQEVLLQSLVLSLYNLDLSNTAEILRGFCGQGDYSLKPEHQRFHLGVNEAYAHMPSDKPVNLHEMPQIWQDKFRLPKHNTAPQIPYSIDNLAKQILLGGRITLLPEHGVFIVTGTKETHVVKLFSRDGEEEESCTCKANKSCHHVHAALLSIGIVKDTKTYKKIHTLQRRTRGYKAGRKRLPAKFAVVEAAEDSKCIDDETDLGNTVLVPALTCGTKTVKRRFSTLIPNNQTSLDMSFIGAVTSTPAKKGRKVDVTTGSLKHKFPADKQPSPTSTTHKMFKELTGNIAGDDNFTDNFTAPIEMGDELPVDDVVVDNSKVNLSNNKQFVPSPNFPTNKQPSPTSMPVKHVNEVTASKAVYNNFDCNFTMPIQVEDDFPDDYGVVDEFNDKLSKNKQFVLNGRQLYPSDLQHLIKNDYVADNTYYYFSDSLLECYLAVLCRERHDTNSVLIASTGSILNYPQMETAMYNALHSFVMEDVPENDIVLVPVVRDSHCRLIVVVKKMKQFIYLDSNGHYDENDVTFLLQTWAGYCQYHDLPFNDKEWSVWVPTDIPQQPNNYDCGAYVCLYAEVLVTQSLLPVQSYHDTNKSKCSKNMFSYRQMVHAKLLKYMREGIPPGILHSVDRTKLRSIHVPAVDNITRVDPTSESSALMFLSSCIKNHWQETSVNCHMGSSCKQLKDDQVLCFICSHWYHLFCIGLNNQQLPKQFICNECRQIRNEVVCEQGRPRRIIKQTKIEDYYYDF